MCENENTQTSKQYQMEDSNPGCLDCETVSQNERIKHLRDQRHSLHHHQPVNSRLHSRNTFISTSHPLLCKPAEARASKWQEQWEQTDSKLKRYNIHPRERLPGGHTLPWRTWRTANRGHSGQTATSAAKHLWGYRAANFFYVKGSHRPRPLTRLRRSLIDKTPPITLIRTRRMRIDELVCIMAVGDRWRSFRFFY